MEDKISLTDKNTKAVTTEAVRVFRILPVHFLICTHIPSYYHNPESPILSLPFCYEEWKEGSNDPG